jgi:hypothetical protein
MNTSAASPTRIRTMVVSMGSPSGCGTSGTGRKVERMNECVVCGEDHGPGPIGFEGGAFAGIEFQACSRLPEDSIYVDQQYASGPRGALLLLALSTTP